MLGRTLLVGGLAACALAASTLTASTVAAPTTALADHKDERLGFSLRLPAKWTEIPLRTDEHWVVGKWACNKVDHWTDPDRGLMTREHRAEFRTVAFIEEVISRPDIEDDDDDEEGRSVTSVRINKVYRDYPDYLRGTFREGYYISKEEPGELNGFQATYYEAIIETDTGAGDRRLIAWVIEMEIAHIALEFEVLEDGLKKKRPLIAKTFKSFKEIPRTIPINMSDYDDSRFTFSSMEKMSPDERARHRRSRVDKEWAKITRSIPEEWSIDEFDGVRVVHKVDAKYAKKVCERVTAVQAWLAETFSEVGPDEYVRMPLVRICSTAEEEGQFWNGQIMFGGAQLITHKDMGGAAGSEWGYINRRTLQMWFQDRDSDLWFGLPAWIRNGIEYALGMAQVKRGNIKFKDDLMNMLRSDFREKGHFSVSELMLMNDSQFIENRRQRDWRADAQSAALVQYLLDKPRGDAKHLLTDYMRHVNDLLAEISAEREAERDDEVFTMAETEDEEEERIKARQDRFKVNERRILEHAYERSFAEWTAKKKTAFEKAFMREIE